MITPPPSPDAGARLSPTAATPTSPLKSRLFAPNPTFSHFSSPSPSFSELPADLLTPYWTARHRLARLLRENPNFTRLRKHVDSKLGIPELLRARRNVREAKSRRKSGSPVIRGATRQMTVDPGRIEATRLALADFLQDKHLSPKFTRLRDAAIRWLRAPPVF